MTRTLYLFKKCKPNTGNNIHYFGTGEQLRALLVTNTSFYVGSFTENSYRIETGHVKLQAQLSNYNAITYIIDEDAETGYFKAYHVMNNSVVGGYVDFSVKVDLWGSNIFLADFSKIHVSRCNRNIGHGWYDKVPASKIDANNYYEPLPIISANNYLTRAQAISNFYVYIVADCVVAQNLIGTDAITARKVYAIPLDHYFDMSGDPDYPLSGKGYKPIDIAADILSGIYKFSSSSWRNYSVSVKSIFIAPKFTPRLREEFDSFSNWGEITNISSYLTDSFIDPVTTYTAFVGDIDYDYYIGAGFNVKPLRRYVNVTDSLIQFIFMINSDGLKVTLRQGNHDDDITSAFVVPITTDAQISDTLSKMAYAISFGLRAFDTTQNALDNDDPTKAITGLAGQLASALQNGGASPSSLNANGDALTTFGWTIPNSESTSDLIDKVSNPYTIFKFKSVRDEKAHARFNGANFDEYILSFSSIISSSLLGSGDLAATYIVVDSVDIKGVQEEAEQFIKGELSQGVYYTIL